ncbi:MAG: sulfotransferase [Cyanobacteria bacterium J06650_10]
MRSPHNLHPNKPDQDLNQTERVIAPPCVQISGHTSEHILEHPPKHTSALIETNPKMARAETKAKTKVLYIAGFERSGSTILNRVLGQIEGFVAWGELRDIWEHGSVENRLCACGAPFNKCKAWSKIMDQAFIRELTAHPAEMVTLKQKNRTSLLFKPLLLPFGPAGRSIEKSVFSRISTPYKQGLTQLYQTIQQKTNSRVIVDSSKASWYGYILSQLPDIDLYTVHIVRDPRGVCHSLQRRKQQGEPECQWYNPVHAALSWRLKNIGVETLLQTAPNRYYQLRYEDFVAQPQSLIADILKLVNEPTTELPFADTNTVKMGLDHIITGSPSSRCAIGAVKLKASEKWMSELNIKDRVLIEQLTTPLLQKYGYK